MLLSTDRALRAERSCSTRPPTPRGIVKSVVPAAAVSLVLALAAATPAQAHIPNDRGQSKNGPRGGWQQDQWNFLPGAGVDAPRAWDNLIAAGRPGGRGVTVAVLDTGVAFEKRGKKFRRSPDFSRTRFVRGYDFCARFAFGQCVMQDRHPNDENGHGTHVAATIAESTNNGIGVTGLAYGATLMPVKVADATGRSSALSIAAGIRYAVKHGAQVINISSAADVSGPVVPLSRELQTMANAVDEATNSGVLVVAGAGKQGQGPSSVAYPAALPSVVAVGATTEHKCLIWTSDVGDWVDLVAPGGGLDASRPEASCRPDLPPGRNIHQMTFKVQGRVGPFAITNYWNGTSMAAPHVSATAALIIASGVLGDKPSPAAIERQLKATAHDLGAPGLDPAYGAGLIDAGAATAKPGR